MPITTPKGRQIPLPEEVYNPYSFGESFGNTFAKTVIQEIENSRLAKAKDAETKRDYAMKLALQEQGQQAELQKQEAGKTADLFREAVTGGKLTPVGGQVEIGGQKFEPVVKPGASPGLLFLDPKTQKVYRGSANPENEVNQITLTEDDKKNLIPIPDMTARNAATDKKVLDRLEKMNKALDPSQSVRTAFGISKIGYDRAERLQSLAETFKDGNLLDSRQIEELAIGLNSLLAGGNVSAQEQVKQLVPKTIWGNTQKTVEWMTNKPQGLQQRAFVERMLGSIEREKNTMGDQIRRTQLSRISQFQDIEKTHPQDFYDTLASWDIVPDDWKAYRKGGFKPTSAVQKPEGAGAPASTGLTPDKEARYQELLKKKQAGTLTR